MEGKFYTSTEAAEITHCSRRQLQYWREKGVIVPTVNSTGKGRNVYYSKADLLALTVMEQLLSIGLNFEVCHAALVTLREQEPWLFDEFFPEEKMKRLMLLPTRSPEQPFQLLEFDKQVALEALCQGQTVIPFWSDRIHQRLRENLRSFER
ncbi:MerR family transcriptional regulator [Nostoc flagelliforme FACHB-838]|uniref:MerR family transcriptional regulator n=1 Tax=Nostoc flagelliforme FACHB-838 TaxID=2692904 RepID=A0ABR8DFE1_9NOSO|nr:MerR family transcriptional regulator [Nostoc flagelliforme]MBD2528023.1 MerR family transcriptional regulator [Nostoc flagelliforme FACHB-838]